MLSPAITVGETLQVGVSPDGFTVCGISPDGIGRAHLAGPYASETVARRVAAGIRHARSAAAGSRAVGRPAAAVPAAYGRRLCSSSR